MKSEIARFDRVTSKHKEKRLLENFSINLFANEIKGIFYINRQGCEDFVKLLQKNSNIDTGYIYIKDKMVNNYQYSDNSLNRVSIIDNNKRLFDEISISDNVNLFYTKNKRIKKSEFELILQKLINSTGIKVSCKRLVKTLTEYERVLIELVKAIYIGSHIIVIDELASISLEQNKNFFNILKNIATNDISIIFFSNSIEKLTMLCDSISIMKDGKILKEIDKKEYNNFDFKEIVGEINIKTTISKEIIKNDNITDICVILKNKEKFELKLGKGNISTIIDVDNSFNEKLINAITDRSNHVYIDDKKTTEKYKPYFIIRENPVKTMLIRDMSYFDNLVFTLCKKNARKILDRRIEKSIKFEYRHLEYLYEKSIIDLPEVALYDLIYHSAELYNPKVLFIVNPFFGIQSHIQEHINKLINMIKENQITVVILSNEPHQFYTDNLFVAKDGEIN